MHPLMQTILLTTWVFALVSLSLGCSPGETEEEKELLVFAAASLTEALNEIGPAFEQRDGVDVTFSFGASQTLAQQIASGAPADVYIAAGKAPMDFLAEKQLLEAEAINVFRNKLLVVARTGVQLDSLQQLNTSRVERIAIANPEAAPAGQYAKESLKSLGLWDAIQPKLVIGADVRATLAYVETGNSDVGLVYSTDARVARNVITLDIVPPETYSPVVYPAAIIQRSERKNGARDFLAFLRGEAAREVFRKYGFEPLE
jgi:molybdate transport system substrate-binding protein